MIINVRKMLDWNRVVFFMRGGGKKVNILYKLISFWFIVFSFFCM